MHLLQLIENGIGESNMRFACKNCGYICKENVVPTKCPICNGGSFLEADLYILQKVSGSQHLIDAMQKLRQTDIIEYELKMTQFRTQYEQQQSLKQTQVQQSDQSDNRPKCPTCGSTNIEKISVGKKIGGSMLFGIFSSDVRNTMHCKDCGAKW